jgi:hypothetical protein
LLDMWPSYRGRAVHRGGPMTPSQRSDVIDLLWTGRQTLEYVGWTQGTYARDTRGSEVPVWSPSGCAFCAAGAIQYPDDYRAACIAAFALNAMARRRGYRSAAWLNDAAATTLADVLDLYDDAIEFVMDAENEL